METTLKPEDHDITRYTHVSCIPATRITAEQLASVQHHFWFDAFDFPFPYQRTTQSPPVKHYCCQRWLKNTSDRWTFISSHSTMCKINIMASS
ncbi:cGMP-dependent protein [Trichinella spiralis]|uniref:cGMP-dependent protein n=1 Tax=Trichinella spiralis TaxID=6334 RepID=A0ABR3L0N7_TRISP